MGPSIMLCRARKNQAGLKAQTRVPLHRAWRDRGRRGGLTKFISYYTLKCDLVMTSVKFNQVLDSVLFKVNQCPSWCEKRKCNTVLLFFDWLLQLWMHFVAEVKPGKKRFNKYRLMKYFLLWVFSAVRVIFCRAILVVRIRLLQMVVALIIITEGLLHSYEILRKLNCVKRVKSGLKARQK